MIRAVPFVLLAACAPYDLSAHPVAVGATTPVSSNEGGCFITCDTTSTPILDLRVKNERVGRVREDANGVWWLDGLALGQARLVGEVDYGEGVKRRRISVPIVEVDRIDVIGPYDSAPLDAVELATDDAFTFHVWTYTADDVFVSAEGILGLEASSDAVVVDDATGAEHVLTAASAGTADIVWAETGDVLFTVTVTE